MSITTTLQALARQAGYSIDSDDLKAALALSWRATAVSDEKDPAVWGAFGHDAFLIPAGRLFGMVIRELHPPEAARGINRLPEFAQHFDASYRPLVERALDHDQAVLAWRGWPGDKSMSWGVITSTCDAGIGLEGVTIGPDDEAHPEPAAPLCSPPIQLYVVESITPAQPDPDELLEAAVAHTAAVLDNRLESSFGILTGKAAYSFWMDRLADATREGGGANSFLAQVRPLVESVAVSHWSGLKFLNRHRVRLREHEHETIDLLTSLCQETIRWLTEAAGCLPLPDGRGAKDALAQVSEALDRAREAASRTHEALCGG